MNTIFVEFLKKYLQLQTDIDENSFQKYNYLIAEKFFFEYFFPNTFYEVLIADNLYYLILSKKKQKLFIFDRNLKYKRFIDLTSIKKIYSNGKYSFVLHFYEGSFSINKLRILFFSFLEKEKFLKDVFTDEKECRDFLLKKVILLNFLSNDEKIEMSLANQFIMLSKKILKRKTEYYPKIYYNRDVNEFFDYNTKDFVSVRNSQNKNNNFVKKRSSQFKLNFFARKFSKKLFFVFNNYKIYDYYFKKIFYGINIVKYEQDYYEDLIDKNILSDLELNSNMIRYKRNNNYKDCNRIDNLTEKYVTEINLSNQEDELSIEFFIKNGFKRKFRKALSINYSNTDTSFLNNLYEFEEKIKPDNPNKEEKDVIKRYSLDNQNEEFFNNNLNPNERGDSGNELNRGIKRQRHVEHKKLKNYLDDSSESKNSLEESILLKSDFEKVSFEVNICYYFSKDPKIIDIHKDGIFSIYKKGKVNLYLNI